MILCGGGDGGNGDGSCCIKYDKSTSTASFRKSKPVNGYDFFDSSESRCFCSMPRTGLLSSSDFISKSYTCIHWHVECQFCSMYNCIWCVTANAQLRNNSIECVHICFSGLILRRVVVFFVAIVFNLCGYDSAPFLSIIFILSSLAGTLLALLRLLFEHALLLRSTLYTTA